MKIRSTAIAGALCLSGCWDAHPTDAVASTDDARIECAIGGAGFSRSCTVERVADSDGLALIVRADDGGFRRLLVTQDGRGVVAADGAHPVVVTIIGEGRIEVAIADERYRLPARIK